MNVIIKAAQFAQRAHDGVKRKFTGLPYLIHLQRVSSEMIRVPEVPEHVVAATWLHDVDEDCPNFRQQFFLDFDYNVIEIVGEVTNPTSKLTPEAKRKLNRKARKAIDFAHVAKAGRWGKILKLLDRIDNIEDLVNCPDIDYRHLYFDETFLLIDAILPGTEGDVVVNILLAKLLDRIKKLSHLGIAA